MTSIIKAGINDIDLLAGMGKKTFIESHGHCAPAADVEAYVTENYSYESFRSELENADNIYHTLFYNNEPAGYSKIILNYTHADIPLQNITKMDRLYLLKEFYGLKLGVILLNHNIQLSKQNGQQGMWLYVWKDNDRAVDFYSKNGFKIVGSHDFKISANHSNPNHQMLLNY